MSFFSADSPPPFPTVVESFSSHPPWSPFRGSIPSHNSIHDLFPDLNFDINWNQDEGVFGNGYETSYGDDLPPLDPDSLNAGWINSQMAMGHSPGASGSSGISSPHGAVADTSELNQLNPEVAVNVWEPSEGDFSSAGIWASGDVWDDTQDGEYDTRAVQPGEEEIAEVLEEISRFWEENVKGHPLGDGSDPGFRQPLCGATGDTSYQFQFNPEAAASGNTSQVHPDGSASWMTRGCDGGNVCIQPGERPSYPSTAYVADTGRRANIVSYSLAHCPGEEYQPGAHGERVDYPPTAYIARTEQSPNIVSDPYAHRHGEGYQPGEEGFDYPETAHVEDAEPRPNIVSDPCTHADIMATQSSRLHRPLPHHSRRRTPSRKRKGIRKVNTKVARLKITKPCLQRPRTLKKLAVSAGSQIGTLPPPCTSTEELRITNPRRVLKRGQDAWACGVDGCSQVRFDEDVSRHHMLTHFDLHIVCFGCNRSFGTSTRLLRRHISHVFKSDKTGPCVKSVGKWVQKSGKSHFNSTNSWGEDSFIENATLIEKGSQFDGGERFVRVKWV